MSWTRRSPDRPKSPRGNYRWGISLPKCVLAPICEQDFRHLGGADLAGCFKGGCFCHFAYDSLLSLEVVRGRGVASDGFPVSRYPYMPDDETASINHERRLLGRRIDLGHSFLRLFRKGDDDGIAVPLSGGAVPSLATQTPYFDFGYVGA